MSISCDWCGRPANEVKNFCTPPDKEEPRMCNYCAEDVSKALASNIRVKAPSTKKEEEPPPNPRQIKAILDRYVIAQERAKINISTAVYNHYKRKSIQGKVKGDVDVQKSNILLSGPSGTGKTELARTIANTLKVPFYVGDATRLTSAGYVGDDIESLFQGLIRSADGDVEKAQWGIIFLDEIDKVARSGGRASGGFRDISGESVQQALLKPLEGSSISVPRNSNNVGTGMSDIMDTTNILFICAGSFAGIEPIVEARCNKKSRMGFGSSDTDRVKMSKSDIYSRITEEDLLDFGMIPEFLGRLPVITTTLELTEEEMLRVLTEPKNSIVKQMEQSFYIDGITLTFTEEALKAIAKEAKTRPTGARALRGIVEKALEKMSFEAPGSDIDSIVVTEKSLVDGDFEIQKKKKVRSF